MTNTRPLLLILASAVIVIGVRSLLPPKSDKPVSADTSVVAPGQTHDASTTAVSPPVPYTLVTITSTGLFEDAPAPRTPGRKPPTFKPSDFSFLDDERRYARIIIDGVNKLVRENPDCAYVSTFTAHMTAPPAPGAIPEFGVDCKNPMGEWLRVKWTAADLKRSAGIVTPTAVTPEAARELCAAMVASRRPDILSAAAVDPWQYQVRAGGRVHILNTIFLSVSGPSSGRYDAHCWFEGEKMIDSSLNRQ